MRRGVAMCTYRSSRHAQRFQFHTWFVLQVFLHDALVCTNDRFAEDIESLVRQRSLQLRKDCIFFCIDVP